MTRRDVLGLLTLGGLGAYACGSYVTPSPSAAAAKLSSTGAPFFPFEDRFPSSPCDVLDAGEGLQQIAFLTLAGGDWGFDSFFFSIRDAYEEVRHRVRERIVDIHVASEFQPCDDDCVFPNIPIGPQFGNTTIAESHPLQLVVDNATCGHGDSPDATRFSDYVIYIGPGDIFSGAAQPFLLVFPSRRLLIVANGRGHFSLVDLPGAALSCFASGFGNGLVGAAALSVPAWPAVSDFSAAFAIIADRGGRVTVAPINVTAHCPSGDCTAPGTRFQLCVGQSAVYEYRRSDQQPF